MNKRARLGIGCFMVLGFSLSSTGPTSKLLTVGYAAPAGTHHVDRVDVGAPPLAGKPKPPKSEDPPAAFDCTSPGLKSIYPSGGPPGKKGKVVKSYLASIRKFIPVFEAKLHHALGIAVCLNNPKQYAAASEDDYASTGVYDPLGEKVGPTISSCWIEINAANLAKQANKNNTLAHELFHCFQGVLVGLATYWSPPYQGWVDEGSAEWAAAIVAGPDKDDGRWWSDYLMNPGVALADVPRPESYREIGFYSHLQESGINPWDAMAPMLTARSDADAFHAAVYSAGAAAAKTFLDSWASGFFRDTARGKAWDTTGPGVPAQSGPTPQALPVGPTDSETRDAQPYTEGLYVLAPAADIVTLQAEGHVRFSDTKTDMVLNGSVDFCAKSGGCECPEGQTYDGPPLTPLNGGSADLALTGAESGSTVTATGASLDDYCSSRDACLFGTWTVTDESKFVSTTSDGAYVLTGMSGTETMAFDKKGKVTVTANNFTVSLAEPDSGGSGSVELSSGTTTAKWDTPTKGDLEFTNIDIGDYVVTLDGDPIGGATFLGNGDGSSMTYTCSGNALDLYPIPSDTSIAPIELTRVKTG